MFKKKEEKMTSPSASQNSQPVPKAKSNESMVPEETKQATQSEPADNLEDFPLPNNTSKKRKALTIEEDEEVQGPSKAQSQSAPDNSMKPENNDLENVENSLKRLKTNSTTSTPSKENGIPINVQKEFPKKDLSKLKKVTDPDYNAYHDAPFHPGEDVPFSFLTDTFEEVSKIKGEHSKEKIVQIISNMYRSILILKPDQLILAYYFCILKIAPDYEPQNMLGIGNEILVKAIAKASGRSEKQIRDSNNQIGDLGKVAAQSKASQSTMDKFFIKNKKAETVVTLRRVMETLRRIAKMKGNNSAIDKEATLVKLLFDAKEDETKYIVRFVQGNLKIGAAEATMQLALNEAFLVHNYINEETTKMRGKWSSMIPDYEKKLEQYTNVIKQAICEYPNYDALIQGLIRVGKDIDKLLEICKITPGVPVKPMLAQPTKGINIVLKRFENMKFTCEFKYDGLRGQIHYHDGKCTIFSRNLENLTEQYPDIVDFILSGAKEDVKSFIIDSEIVAINPVTQKILPFQKLATRGRKNVDKNAIEINVCLYVFDILYFNGEPLTHAPLKERRKYLYEHFKEVENKMRFAQHLDCDTFEEVEAFLYESIKVGCEGLMIKTLEVNAHYQPSKRSLNWLKLKKDYLDTGLGDSFDLVPIGALYGTGKRAGLFGSFLLACYNQDMERYETFCKTSTGLSDEQLEKFHKLFSEHIIKEPLAEYCMSKDQEMDVWFEPCMVWEIKGADIQISPIYTACLGMVDEHKGVGLRFPRLIRVREDKKPTDATDSNQIYEVYKNQAAVLNDINIPDADEIY